MYRKFLLLLALLVMPGVAHADWYEASSAHFVVYSEDSPERLKRFADNLERFDQAERALRNMPNDPVDPANRVTVYLLGSADEIARLIGSENVAGFYIGRASGSVAFAPRDTGGRGVGQFSAQAVLFHEYTHHLMLSIYTDSAFPAWLIEGWAEFHATAAIQNDGSVLFGTAPDYRSWGLLSGNPLPIERMLGGDLRKLTDEQVEALYGRGWALTHYLSFEPSRKGQLIRYIGEINNGKPPAEAAASAFGDLRQLERELNGFINKRRIAGTTVPASAIQVGAISIRKLTPGEAATMDVRVLSKRGVDDKTAPGVYAQAKAAAAPYPNDVGAQLVLAEAAYDAKDYAGSEAAADRAIAANPNAIDAHIYKAMSRMAIAVAKKDGTPETWRAIRKIIATANRIDPNDPEPLILFFQSYTQSGVALTETAKDGLYRAYELAPFDRELRINVAQLFLHDGSPAAARKLLVPLAYDPHGGGLAKAAQEMIAEIDGRAKPAAAPTPAKAGR